MRGPVLCGSAGPARRLGAWAAKFVAAGRGIGRALRTESSFRVHLPAAVVALAAGALFRIAPLEWAMLAVTVGGVIAAELFNSAIEHLARGPGSRRHPRLRDALDIASGGVLVMAVAAVAVGIAIFLPRLLAVVAASG